MTQYPNYEAHGLAIIALANRIFRWPAETIEHALITVTIVATAAPRAACRASAPGGWPPSVVAVAGSVTLAWTGTAEVYAAHGESLFSAAAVRDACRSPRTGSTARREGGSVVFLGQAVKDPNPVNLLEFWNRSLTKVWALDGTAPGPGATATPDLDDPDGTLRPRARTSSSSRRASTSPADRSESRSGDYTLFRLDGAAPLRTAQTGVYPDGWMGPSASYSQYDVPPGTHGHVRVDLHARPGAARRFAAPC